MYYDVQKSAERIRDLRTGSNLTQSEAAEKMGFSLSGYRKLEQAQNGGSIDSLIMVADYYHISLDYLVYGEERDYITSLSEGLTDSQKRVVRATIASLIQNIKIDCLDLYDRKFCTLSFQVVGFDITEES